MVADCFVNASRTASLADDIVTAHPARQVPNGTAIPAATQPSALARRLTPYVRAARDGDAAAFERLVELTRGTVMAIAVAALRDADLGADIAQDVFLAAWRGIGDLRDPERFLPWLRQLTRNRVREVLRRCLRRRGHLYLCARSAHAEDATTAVPDPGPSPVDAIIAAEDCAAKSATLSALNAAVAALPATSRRVFLLYYGAQRSAPEVARELDLSADAVRQRLSRARAQLRAALGVSALGTDARRSGRHAPVLPDAGTVDAGGRRAALCPR